MGQAAGARSCPRRGLLVDVRRDGALRAPSLAGDARLLDPVADGPFPGSADRTGHPHRCRSGGHVVAPGLAASRDSDAWRCIAPDAIRGILLQSRPVGSSREPRHTLQGPAIFRLPSVDRCHPAAPSSRHTEADLGGCHRFHRRLRDGVRTGELRL